MLKFIHERSAAYASEDPHVSQGPEEVGRMLWAALGVMVKHDGVLLRHPQAKKPPAVRACKAPCANVQCVCVLRTCRLCVRVYA